MSGFNVPHHGPMGPPLTLSPHNPQQRQNDVVGQPVAVRPKAKERDRGCFSCDPHAGNGLWPAREESDHVGIRRVNIQFQPSNCCDVNELGFEEFDCITCPPEILQGMEAERVRLLHLKQDLAENYPVQPVQVNPTDGIVIQANPASQVLVKAAPGNQEALPVAVVQNDGAMHPAVRDPQILRKILIQTWKEFAGHNGHFQKQIMEKHVYSYSICASFGLALLLLPLAVLFMILCLVTLSGFFWLAWFCWIQPKFLERRKACDESLKEWQKNFNLALYERLGPELSAAIFVKTQSNSTIISSGRDTRRIYAHWLAISITPRDAMALAHEEHLRGTVDDSNCCGSNISERHLVWHPVGGSPFLLFGC